MELMEVIQKRVSVRKYRRNPVPEDKVNYVLEAARLAPSWNNGQCWKFIVVTDEELKKKLTKLDWAVEAPILIVACADPKKSGNKNGQDYYLTDIGVGLEHLMLAAVEQGLGTCWICLYFDEKNVRNTLNISKKYRVVAITPLGYPMDEVLLKPKERKNLEEIVSKNASGLQ